MAWAHQGQGGGQVCAAICTCRLTAGQGAQRAHHVLAMGRTPRSNCARGDAAGRRTVHMGGQRGGDPGRSWDLGGSARSEGPSGHPAKLLPLLSDGLREGGLETGCGSPMGGSQVWDGVAQMPRKPGP